MLKFPEIDKNDIPHIKRIIIAVMIVAVVVCVINFKEEVLAVISNHYEDTLPIYSVETEEKVVSITFDAAWGDEDLKDILDILDRHNCKATFFITPLEYPNKPI